jgi:hypothetical protein
LKYVGTPVDSHIIIYKNPRRVVFAKYPYKRLKRGKKLLFQYSRFCEAISMASIFSILPVVIAASIFKAYIFAGYFMIFMMPMYLIINLLSYRVKFFSSIYPTLVWLSGFGWLGKPRIIRVKHWYNTKLSLMLPYFMFINYKMTGDWTNYKKISLNKITPSRWQLDIFLNKIVEHGQLTLRLR